MERFCSEGMGILMVSSELPETMAICDRVYILNEGRMTGHFEKKAGYDQFEIMKAVFGENDR